MNYLNDIKIRSKSDIEHVSQIIELGFPSVEPLLPHLFEWIQDMNWPVAKRVAPFLVSIGRPMFPALNDILAGADLSWQYWCISDVIGKLPKELASDYRTLLERIAYSPTDLEKHHELSVVALDAVRSFGWARSDPDNTG